MHLWASYFRSIKRIDGIRWGVKPAQMRTCEGPACDKVHIYDADQSKSSHLRRVVIASFGTLEYTTDMSAKDFWARVGYDIIIDDGTHVPRHMLLSFQTLWPYVRLRPGGLYVLEDIGFSYADRPRTLYGNVLGSGGLGKTSPDNIVEKFKQLADLVSRPWCMPDAKFTVFTPEVDETIWSVQFVSGISSSRR